MSDKSEEEQPAPSTPKKTLIKREEIFFSTSQRDKHRAQEYRHDWEKLDFFKDWLGPGKNQFKARCTVCDVEMVLEYGDLKLHSSRQKHIKAMSAIPSKTKQRDIMSAFVTKGVMPKNKVVTATEIKFSGV